MSHIIFVNQAPCSQAFSISTETEAGIFLANISKISPVILATILQNNVNVKWLFETTHKPQFQPTYSR